MRLPLVALITLTSSFAFAMDSASKDPTWSKAPVFKSWKTFQSDYGFEFKYPDCWKITSEDLNFIGSKEPLSRHNSIFASEAGDCITPNRDRYVGNGISFDALRVMNQVEIKDAIDERERQSSGHLSVGAWAIFKHFKNNEDHDVIAFVENHMIKEKTDFIRWNFEVFCNNRRIIIVAASISNPSQEFFKKFQQGDLAIPEPQKTIFESFKCTESKIKTDRAAPHNKA